MRVSYHTVKVKRQPSQRRFILPPIGFRIIKTCLAVFFCLLVYVLRGYKGMIGESVVTAILCIQPFTSESVKTGWERLLGTAIGAGWGLLFLILFQQSPVFAENMLLTYAVIALGVLVSIYSTVLLKVVNSSAITAIIFYCVVGDYPHIVSPLLQTRDRLLDTLIGVLIGVLINGYTLPRDKIDNRVFFVNFQDIIPNRLSTLSPKVFLSLGYLFQQKAKICLMTRYAPAFLIPQIRSMDVTMPCIVMDGAASYDIRFNHYVRTIPVEHEKSHLLEKRFQALGLGYSVFAIRNDSMMIYRQGAFNQGEEDEYTIMRCSPYRNYIDGSYGDSDQILGLRLFVPENELEETKAKLLTPEILENFTVSEMSSQGIYGFATLCFKDKKASFEEMQRMVMEYLHFSDFTEVFSMESQSDSPETAFPTEHDAMNILGRIKHLYEPISFFALDQKGRVSKRFNP